jgi:hypothetical protein
MNGSYGTDGDEPLAEQRMRQACRPQQQEEVHFGNAELDMLAFRGEAPFLRRRDPDCFQKWSGKSLPGRNYSALTHTESIIFRQFFTY